MIGAIQKPLIRSPGRVAMDSVRGYYDYAIPWYAGFSKLADSLVLDLPAPLTAPKNRTSILDISGKGNDGTITGATWFQHANGLWVPSFDRVDDLISISSSPAFAFGSGEFTVETWFRLTDTSDHQAIFAGTSDFWVGVFFSQLGGLDKLGYFASSNGANWDLIAADAPPTNGVGSNIVTAGIWHHFVYTRTGNAWKGYLDNVEDLSVTVAGSLVTLDEPKILGRWGNGSYWFGGRIGMFRFYNRGLTSAEVVSIFNQERVLFGV